MRRIKAIVYGVGAMNSVATRLMIEKGVDIVGALARSPEKVGHDLGDVAGLGFQTGVLIDDDPERVLAHARGRHRRDRRRELHVRHVRASSPLRRARRQRRDDLRGGALPLEHVADAAGRARPPGAPQRRHDHRHRPPGRLLGEPRQHGAGDRAPDRVGHRAGELERGRLRARGRQGPARRHHRRGFRHLAGRGRPAAELRPQHARRARLRPRPDGRRARARRVPRSPTGRLRPLHLGITVEPAA